MMDLEISPDNRFVAAYTNNNQVSRSPTGVISWRLGCVILPIKVFGSSPAWFMPN